MSDQETRIKELGDWIDTQVIAAGILDELLDCDIEPTVKNGKKVWLDILEAELPGAIRSTIHNIF